MGTQCHHDTDLVVEALIDALGKHSPPAIVHQDQGSEYCSERYDIIALSQGVELSFSAKGHHGKMASRKVLSLLQDRDQSQKA